MMPVFLFSLGESESGKTIQMKEILNGDRCTLLGLLLHRHDATSFKRIGTFKLYNEYSNGHKKKILRGVFQNAQRESVTVV
jgi:hypothetical protein